MRGFMKWFIRLLVAGVAVGLLVAIALSGGARRGESSTSAVPQPVLSNAQLADYIIRKACGGFELPQQGGVTRIIRGFWHSSSGPAPEVTAVLQGGGYTVIRCTNQGRLAISQTNAPIRVPGGGTSLLPVSTSRPAIGPHPRGAQLVVTNSASFADPRDPHWRYLWTHEKARILAQVIPPTKPAP